MVAVPLQRPLQGYRSLGPGDSITPGQEQGCQHCTHSDITDAESCVLDITYIYGASPTHHRKGFRKMAGHYL